MSLTTGTRLGAYEILSAIGVGGMGEVYRARDMKLDRDVAIKVLPEAFAADPDRIARFQREAKTLAALNHPHIGAIYGIEEGGGTHALVMELVEGEDLSQRISRGRIPVDEALPIAKQIAEALEAAHEQGIIHRDLKPANIKVTPDGNVKVLDFGLAKLTDAKLEPPNRDANVAFDWTRQHPPFGGLSMSPTVTSPAMMTGIGVLLGTAAYMSPEQAKGKPADKRSDIWAFGCVLYEMLTARRAFDGEDMVDVLGAVARLDPSWDALPSDVPPSVRTLLHGCLIKDRRKRIGDIAAALFAIDEASVGGFGTASVSPLVRKPGWNRVAALTVAAGLLIVTVVAVVAGVMAIRRPVSALPLTRLELSTPPTTDPFSFALSPDGRQIVYVATAEGESKLWLRPLDQPTARPLVGTDGALYPFWAPDGRAIGFFADGKLKRVDLNGGGTAVLAAAPVVYGGTWSRDGVIVFAPSGTAGLMQVAADGGMPTTLTKLTPGQTAHRLPQFLPDGRRFLFWAFGPAERAVYVGSLDGGEPTRVVAAASSVTYVPPGYLLLLSEGVLMARRFDAAHAVLSGDSVPIALSIGADANGRSAVSVSATGVLAHRSGTPGQRQFAWVDRTGKQLGVLGPAEDTGLSYTELAPDGRRLAAYRNVQGNADIWLIEVAHGIARRFTFDPAVDSSPLWSPDGRRLVFRSVRNGGTYNLFEKPADGATDEQPLLVTRQDKAPQAWSPDGRFLLYTVQDPKTQSDLWALPLGGDRKPLPVVQTNFDEVQGQFSPDGHWIAYASNESGRYEIYTRPFLGSGSTSQVSTGGGISPRWRRDGKELFYISPDNHLMAAPMQVDGRTLSPGAPVALFATRLTTGNTNIGGYSSRAQYAVAPDGRFLMNVSADDATTAPITIVQNWTALLKP